MRTVGVVAAIGAGCRSMPEPQPFAACFERLDPDATTYPYGDEAFTGAVVESGVGDPPVDCFSHLPLQTTDDRVTDPTWARVAEDGGDWLVALWTPDGLAPLDVGESVDLRLGYSTVSYGGPTVGLVEIVRADGLYAWFGRAPSVDELTPPAGIRFARGGRVRTTHDHCGAVRHYDLEVDGETVPYGAQLEVDGIDVRHGGVDRSVDRGGMPCLDWYVANAAVALIGD